MTHQELSGYFQRMLPEEFLSLQQISGWRWKPEDAEERGDARIGIGDSFQVWPLRPTEGFSEHSNDFFTLYYCFAGIFSFEFDKEIVQITAGQVLFVNRLQKHRIQPCGNEDLCIYVAIHPELLARQPNIRELPAFWAFLQGEGKPAYRLFCTEAVPVVRWYLEEICCEQYDPDRHTYIMMPSLLFLLLPALDRCADVEFRGHPGPGWTTEQIVRYIRTNFDTVKLQSAARRFGFAPNYLSHLLKKNTGMGFQELKQDAAISQGARMLRETDLTVAQIAQTVGIRNITHFYSLFSARYGVTPAQYRKRQ